MLHAVQRKIPSRLAFVAIFLSLSAMSGTFAPLSARQATQLAAQEQEKPQDEPEAMDLPPVPEGLGPGAWYFEGKKIELGQGLAQERNLDSADSVSLMEFMYGLAFRFGEKESAEEAGKSLADIYIKQNRLELAQGILREWIGYFGPDWDVYRKLIDVLAGLGDYRNGLAIVAEVRKALPQTAKKNISELNWLEYSFRSSLNDFAWTQAATPLLNAASVDAWNAKTLKLFAESPGITAEMAEEALLRADFAQKNYDAVIEQAQKISTILHRGPVPRVFVSETGKAFLNAGRYDDGLRFFAQYFIVIPETMTVPENLAPESPTSAGTAPADTVTANAHVASAPAFNGETIDIASLLEAIRVATSLDNKPEQRIWVAAYYVARLFLASGKSNEAGIIFLELADAAPSSADADGALWYWLDITMKQIEDNAFEDLHGGTDTTAKPETQNAETQEAPPAPENSAEPTTSTQLVNTHRSLEIAALTEASLHWKDASYFDDILEAYVRRILKEKTWDDVQSLLILIGGKVSGGVRTKLLYISGRLLEEGLAGKDLDQDTRKSIASEFFRALLSEPSVEEYYRTMASWRLGQLPPFLTSMPDLAPKHGGGAESANVISGDDTPGNAAGAEKTSVSAVADSSAATDTATAGMANAAPILLPAEMSLIQNYLAYDLDDLAGKAAMNYLGAIDKYTVARLAEALETEGQYYPALRLARDALSRGADDRCPELYGIVYPKAWNEAVAENASRQGIPEALAYGIIRSESVFNPSAVSYSGAVGLTQLMPGTAAETASGLKMSTYSLTNPEDNLRIGLTYYGYMLARFGNKPMRAMFAYNAGPSRMKTWNAESGELPDDILLEALHIAQTRQYGKNIIQATLAYGKIHYSIEPAALLDYLVYGKPLSDPEKQQQEEQPTEPAQETSGGSFSPAPQPQTTSP